MRARVVVVIPTYNERANVGALIDALQRAFRRMSGDMRILVVDDNSPDGTADVVRDKQGQYDNIDLLTGEKAGLGAAYIRGMRHALSELDAAVVCEMDADFSHDPEDVPRLVAGLEQGADFVIGSRYVRGGSIPGDWGLFRRLNSTLGNLVARRVAGLSGVQDCTAGFRAIRGSLLRRIDLEALEARGYAFQVDLLNQSLLQGGRVLELPVEFADRKVGDSKLGMGDILEFFWIASRIRWRRSTRFLKFCAVGASGAAVNLGVFSTLLLAGLGPYVASPIAIETSIVSNFLFNDQWTFRGGGPTGVPRRALRFNLISVLALGISYTTFVLLSLWFPRLAPQLRQLIGIGPPAALSYLLNSRWTFGARGEAGGRRDVPAAAAD